MSWSDRLIEWLVDQLIDCLVASSLDWLIDDWSTDWFTHTLIDWSIDWLMLFASDSTWFNLRFFSCTFRTKRCPLQGPRTRAMKSSSRGPVRLFPAAKHVRIRIDDGETIYSRAMSGLLLSCRYFGSPWDRGPSCSASLPHPAPPNEFEGREGRPHTHKHTDVKLRFFFFSM